MPTQNVSLSEKQAAFIKKSLNDGSYRNASEVVRTALRLLEQREKEDKLKLRALRRLATEAFDELDRGEYEVVEPGSLDQFIAEIWRQSASAEKMNYTLRFSNRVADDMEEVLAFTAQRFGERKCLEYQELLRLALADIFDAPERPPAKRRVDIHPDALTFHIARRGKRARHFFLYRIVDNQDIEIARLLHDSVDLARHLPDDFGGPNRN